MPHILDGFDYPTQDRLYALKCDVRVGERSDFGRPALTSYCEMQTHIACRYTGDPWNVVLMIYLATTYGVAYYCAEGNDSLGDWLAVHGYCDDGEAA